ncbi:MAG: CaiB/BaiF CoA-transferase family protein [Burkholderiaceae bacterium]
MNQAPRDDRDEPLLAGFTVLDFTRALAGPYCTRLLADLGAQVIKIERPGEGDEVRYVGMQLDPERTGQSAYFARVNAGKHSVGIDLQHPQAREIVLDLVRHADVVVENFSPGVMAKYRFDYDTLRQVRPDLVYCSISGFGQTGPLSSMQAYAHLINAISGMMELERGGSGAPRASNLQAADVLAGLHAFGAINAALLRRARRGQGAYIDVSMLESLIAADDLTYAILLNGGKVERQPRIGLGVYPVRDRHMALQIGGASGMWPRMVALIGRPELLEDPRFVTPTARRDNWPALVEVITQWLSGFENVDAAVAAAAGARIPCAPVLMPEEVVVHPHMQARGAFPLIDHPSRGQVRVTASPFQVDGAATLPAGSAPFEIGQDTRRVLADVLGYDAARIGALLAAGAVSAPA